jgi:eukaryotic-like serine/threonine-protein kinase
VRQSPNAKDVETLAAPASGPAASGDRHRPAAFENGAVIAGKYLIEETIAQGGIGVVVVAKHLALQQRVAIKYLRPRALSNPVIVERFVREARLAAQITSEHVVRVHDVGTLPEAGPYMVMEYLVGEDLGRTLHGGPLPVARAIDYVLQACDALAEAHALRIVHRDIKPENMFLAQRASNTPLVKIIDFGISKISPRRGEDGQWGTETESSERFGTPLYMSPEQLRSSSNVDARTDIWSLGVVLHELITGVLPFQGEALPQICTSVLSGRPIPLTKARPDAPPLLEPIILKCLEKDPARRYRNVAELAQELVAFGPPSAIERVERIFEVVRRGGDSIRPPAAAGGIPQLPPSSYGSRSSLTDARAVTTVNVRGQVVGPRSNRKAALALAAVVCVAFLAAVAGRRALSAAPVGHGLSNPLANTSPPPPPSAAPIEAPTASSVSAGEAPAAAAGSTLAADSARMPPDSPVPAESSAAPASAPPASAPPPSAVTPPPINARPKSVAPRTHVAAPPSPSALSKPPPSTPSSRRAQFGERE